MQVTSSPLLTSYAMAPAPVVQAVDAAPRVPGENSDNASGEAVPGVNAGEKAYATDQRRGGKPPEQGGPSAEDLETLQKIRELQARDREVRAHEAAHASVGGHLTGTPTYSYERGPDGVNYAVEGQVSVKSPEVPGDPEKTLQQAEQVRRAALAPAEPSAADRQVAADAARVAAEARAELARGDEDTDALADSDRKDDIDSDGSDMDGDGASSEPRRSADTSSEAAAGQAGAALYRDIENGVPNAGPGRVALQA